MAFKMIHGDKDIRIHDGTTDLGFFDIFSAFHRDIYLVCSFQAIGDQHVAARVIRVKPVLICTLQVIERIFSAAYIQRVAVCQERFAAKIGDQIHHGTGVIWTQESQIARLSKMNLDRHIFSV